jgi:hypothetical protein
MVEDEARYDTFSDYTNIYDTPVGPAVRTEGSSHGKPRFTVVIALLSKLQHYGSKKDLVEEEDFTVEQVEEALAFNREEEFTDLRKKLEESGFPD